MLESIFHAGSFDLINVALSMMVALILGLLIALCYKMTDKSSGYLPLMLAVMPLLVAVIILLINGNLGTSVAVLGAFGLVRFRSASGNAKDIGFIFFSMAVGLAAGLGFLTLAALVTGVVILVFLLLDRIGMGDPHATERMLRITIPEDLNYNGLFDDLFTLYTRGSRLIQVKTTNMGTLYELTYRLRLKEANSDKVFMDALRCRNGNLNISLGLVQKEKNEL